MRRPVSFGILLTAVLGLGAALLVAVRALHVAEIRSCGVVVTLDRVYREVPPQTPAGREMAAPLAALRRTYDYST
ncbi:hypothetical protein OG559_02510 [Micromonospora sp. NBC_01405]|uniref:hypothetical protein n=1 Tax=Micromonospora sp. NBC_01405 TaxID=2903589 RepID=UPI00324BD0A2